MQTRATSARKLIHPDPCTVLGVVASGGLWWMFHGEPWREGLVGRENLGRPKRPRQSHGSVATLHRSLVIPCVPCVPDRASFAPVILVPRNRQGRSLTGSMASRTAACQGIALLSADASRPSACPFLGLGLVAGTFRRANLVFVQPPSPEAGCRPWR